MKSILNLVFSSLFLLSIYGCKNEKTVETSNIDSIYTINNKNIASNSSENEIVIDSTKKEDCKCKILKNSIYDKLFSSSSHDIEKIIKENGFNILELGLDDIDSLNKMEKQDLEKVDFIRVWGLDSIPNKLRKAKNLKGAIFRDYFPKGINKLKQLEFIEVYEARGILDDQLNDLENLEYLVFAGKDIVYVRENIKLKSVKHFNVWLVGLVGDYSFVNNMTCLKTLDIHYDALPKLDASKIDIKNLSCLERINIETYNGKRIVGIPKNLELNKNLLINIKYPDMKEQDKKFVDSLKKEYKKRDF